MKKVVQVFLILIFTVTLAYAQDEAKKISYNKFLPFLPEKIGSMVKEGEPDGSTTKMGGMSMTEVTQSYVDPGNAEKKASVRISYNSMLAAAGSFGMMIPDMEEESTGGYKKTINIMDYKALVEYENGKKYARIMANVGPVMLEVDATGVENENLLLDVIKVMDLKTLEKTSE